MTLPAQLRNLGRRTQERWRRFRARHPSTVQTLKRAALVGAVLASMGLRTRKLAKASSAAWGAAKVAPLRQRAGLARGATAVRQRFHRLRLATFLTGGLSVPYLAAPGIYHHARGVQRRREHKLANMGRNPVLTKRKALVVRRRVFSS